MVIVWVHGIIVSLPPSRSLEGFMPQACLTFQSHHLTSFLACEAWPGQYMQELGWGLNDKWLDEYRGTLTTSNLEL